MECVSIWEETISIPTYEIGTAEKNPIFLNKRVYQGSSGKIYPYPAVEKIKDEKVNKLYQAVYLENEYLKVMILPELGGRIQRAYDKTNQYDFVYYNHVIKPALVGLTGPWISGGIEFNWPQHHRPTTYCCVDYLLCENEDGSKTVKLHDADQIYGTEAVVSFTLYKGKAYIEIEGQLYNGTSMPQTFLWWANPAVPVNDNTQSVFPPDVHAVMDHGKRDVSRFPIATGTYYKHDYSEGVDISRYKNIPVPTSYMAEKSNYDFVGGYDHKLRAGILHVADHHISPGKKQWTWGCGDFGKAWDRNLTDEDGPYIELMTGVYTDNQPDFTWLKPFEEKSFKQYFMPYKAVGMVKNASIYAAVNMEQRKEGLYLCVYGTQKYEGAIVRVFKEEKIIWEEETILSPVDIYEKIIPCDKIKESKLRVEILEKEKVSAKEKILVSYQPEELELAKIPEPAQAAKDPEEIMTNEELYLTGLHLEQYRHATYQPEDYYKEGLKRDNEDIRINNAYGRLLMSRGCFHEAEIHFRKAIKRLTFRNPNPYNSEPYYNLGLVLLHQEKLEEAYDAFFKAAWSNEQQEMSFYYLAAIETRRENYEHALELIEKGLMKNTHNKKARGMKAYLLRILNQPEKAKKWIIENLALNPFDYVSRVEKSELEEENKKSIWSTINHIMRNFPENYLQTARDYAEFGAYKEAIEVINQCNGKTPMLFYYKAYYLDKLGKENDTVLKQAQEACTDYCFPNKLEDIHVLMYAIHKCPAQDKAYYYLGNLYYDKKQNEAAKKLWEEAAKLCDDFPIIWRNLALVYYNEYKEKEKAKKALEKANQLAQKDSRIFLELDQLYKKIGITAKERLQNYEAAEDIIKDRDDLFIEYVTLHNLLGNYKKAYELIMSRKFHPWEGGEGKVTAQYTISLVETAKDFIKQENYKEAIKTLNQALYYPQNLGEGKLEGTKDNHIYHYMGLAFEQIGEKEKAKACFETAAIKTGEAANMMYYNDQPADMILYQGLSEEKLEHFAQAKACFYQLIDYGEKHIFDHVKMEYFAVSLPDFLIFEDDLNEKNQSYCYYLIGLGNLGLKNYQKAIECFTKTLEYDKNYQKAIIYKKWAEDLQSAFSAVSDSEKLDIVF